MTVQSPAIVADARLSHALSCWQRWRQGQEWPTRADIDPADLRLLLANLFVVEAVDGGDRFRYALAGKTVRDTLGFELSGQYLEDLFHGETLDRAMANYRTVLAGLGHYSVQRWLQRGRPIIRFRRLLLPLASDRSHIDGILGFALYDHLPDHDGKPVDHFHDPVTIETEQEAPLALGPPRDRQTAWPG